MLTRETECGAKQETDFNGKMKEKVTAEVKRNIIIIKIRMRKEI